MTAANRGKVSEARIKAHLKGLSESYANFSYERVYDAHAAGGRAQAQAGDFRAFHRYEEIYAPDSLIRAVSRNWVIEVKEVGHDYRLAHKNFGEDKVARMQKAALSGREPVVVVYHTATKLWRIVPFEVFLTRTGGSWNLTPYEAMTTAPFFIALNKIFGLTK